MKDPEDEAFEELSLKQGQWQYTSGWRKKQILETGMTQDEIFNMAVKCYLISTGNREGFYGDALIQFAKLVAEKALKDHAMQEVQRLGQEIEQAPVQQCRACFGMGFLDGKGDQCLTCNGTGEQPPQRTWVGLTDDEIDYLIHLAYTGDEEFVQTIEAKLKEKNK
jgi:hypothetical protein